MVPDTEARAALPERERGSRLRWVPATAGAGRRREAQPRRLPVVAGGPAAGPAACAPGAPAGGPANPGPASWAGGGRRGDPEKPGSAHRGPSAQRRTGRAGRGKRSDAPESSAAPASSAARPGGGAHSPEARVPPSVQQRLWRRRRRGAGEALRRARALGPPGRGVGPRPPRGLPRWWLGRDASRCHLGCSFLDVG